MDGKISECGWILCSASVPKRVRVLAEDDIATSYHLAVTVDDETQEIPLVIREKDLFESTHIHHLLQALLELPVPQWHHHRLICDPDGKRLAKRDAATALGALREDGVTLAEVQKRLGIDGNVARVLARNFSGMPTQPLSEHRMLAGREEID